MTQSFDDGGGGGSGLVLDPETGELVSEEELRMRRALRAEARATAQAATRPEGVGSTARLETPAPAPRPVVQDRPEGVGSTARLETPAPRPRRQQAPPPEQTAITGAPEETWQRPEQGPVWEDVPTDEEIGLAEEEEEEVRPRRGILPPEPKKLSGILPSRPEPSGPLAGLGILPPRQEPIAEPEPYEPRFSPEEELEREQAKTRTLEDTNSGTQVTEDLLRHSGIRPSQNIPRDRVVMAPGLNVPLYLRGDEDTADLQALDQKVSQGLSQMGLGPLMEGGRSILEALDAQESDYDRRLREFNELTELPAGQTLQVTLPDGRVETVGTDMLAFLQTAPKLLPAVTESMTDGQKFLANYYSQLLDYGKWIRDTRGSVQGEMAAAPGQMAQSLADQETTRLEAANELVSATGSLAQDPYQDLRYRLERGLIKELPVTDIREALRVTGNGLVDLRKDERGTYLLNQTLKALTQHPDNQALQMIQSVVEENYGLNPAVSAALIKGPEFLSGQEMAEVDSIAQRSRLTRGQQVRVIEQAATLERDRVQADFAAMFPDEAGSDVVTAIRRLSATEDLSGVPDRLSQARAIQAELDPENPLHQPRLAGAQQDVTDLEFMDKVRRYLDLSPLPEALAWRDTGTSTMGWLAGGAVRLAETAGSFLGPVVDNPLLRMASPVLNTVGTITHLVATHGDEVLDGLQYTSEVTQALTTSIFTTVLPVTPTGAALDVGASLLGESPPATRLRSEWLGAMTGRSPQDAFNIQRQMGTTMLYHGLRGDEEWQRIQAGIAGGQSPEALAKQYANPWLEFVGQAVPSLFLDPLVIGWRLGAIPVDSLKVMRQVGLGSQMKMVRPAARSMVNAQVGEVMRVGEIERKFTPFWPKVLEARPELRGNPEAIMHELFENQAKYLDDPSLSNWARRWIFDVPGTRRPEATTTGFPIKDISDWSNLRTKYGGDVSESARQINSLTTTFHAGRGSKLFGKIAGEVGVQRLLNVAPDQVRPLTEAFNDSRFYFDGNRSAGAARLQAGRIADETTGVIDTLMTQGHRPSLSPTRQWVHTGDIPRMVDQAKALSESIFRTQTITGEAATKALQDFGVRYGFLPSSTSPVSVDFMRQVQALGSAKFTDDVSQEVLQILRGGGIRSRAEVLGVLHDGIGRGLVESVQAGGIRLPFTQVNVPNPFHLTDHLGKTITVRGAGITPEMRRVVEDWKTVGRTTDVLPTATDARIRELGRRAGVVGWRDAPRNEILSKLAGREGLARWRPTVQISETRTPGGKLAYGQLTLPERIQNVVVAGLSIGFLNTPRFIIRNLLNNQFTMALDGWSPYRRLDPLFHGKLRTLQAKEGVSAELERLGISPLLVEGGRSGPSGVRVATGMERLQELSQNSWYGDAAVSGTIPAYIRNPARFMVNPASFAEQFERGSHLRIIAQAYPQAFDALNGETVQSFWEGLDQSGIVVEGRVRSLFEAALRSDDPRTTQSLIQNLKDGLINPVRTNEFLAPPSSRVASAPALDTLGEALGQGETVQEVSQNVRRVIRSFGVQLRDLLGREGLDASAEAVSAMDVAFSDAVYQGVARGMDREGAIRNAQVLLSDQINKASGDTAALEQLRSWIDMPSRADSLFSWTESRTLAGSVLDAIHNPQGSGYDNVANTLRAQVGDAHEEQVGRVLERLMAVKDEDLARPLVQSILMREFHGVNLDPARIIDNVPPHIQVGGRAVPLQRQPRPSVPSHPLTSLNGDAHLMSKGPIDQVIGHMSPENQAFVRTGAGELDTTDPAAAEWLRRKTLLSLPAAAPLGAAAADDEQNPLSPYLPDEVLLVLGGVGAASSLRGTALVKLIGAQLERHGTLRAATQFRHAVNESKLLPKLQAGTLSSKDFLTAMRRLDLSTTVNAGLDSVLKNLDEGITGPLPYSLEMDGRGNQVFQTAQDAALALREKGFGIQDITPLYRQAAAGLRNGQVFIQADVPEGLAKLLREEPFYLWTESQGYAAKDVFALYKAVLDDSELARIYAREQKVPVPDIPGRSQPRRQPWWRDTATSKGEIRTSAAGSDVPLDLAARFEQAVKSVERLDEDALLGGPVTGEVRSDVTLGRTLPGGVSEQTQGYPEELGAFAPSAKQTLRTPDPADTGREPAGLAARQEFSTLAIRPASGRQPITSQTGGLADRQVRDRFGDSILRPSYESMLEDLTEDAWLNLSNDVKQTWDQEIQTLIAARERNRELVQATAGPEGKRGDVRARDLRDQWLSERLGREVNTKDKDWGSPGGTGYNRINAQNRIALELVADGAAWQTSGGKRIQEVVDQEFPDFSALKAQSDTNWQAWDAKEKAEQTRKLTVQMHAEILRNIVRGDPDAVPMADRDLLNLLVEHQAAKDVLATTQRGSPEYNQAYEAWDDLKNELDTVTGRSFRPEILDWFELESPRGQAPRMPGMPQGRDGAALGRWAADAAKAAQALPEKERIPTIYGIWDTLRTRSTDLLTDEHDRLTDQLVGVSDIPSLFAEAQSRGQVMAPEAWTQAEQIVQSRSGGMAEYERNVQNAQTALDQLRTETGPRFYAGDRTVGTLTTFERTPVPRSVLSKPSASEGNPRLPESDWVLMLPAPSETNASEALALVSDVVGNRARWVYDKTEFGDAISIHIQDAQQLSEFMGKIDSSIDAYGLGFLKLDIRPDVQRGAGDLKDLSDAGESIPFPDDEGVAGIRAVMGTTVPDMATTPMPVWKAPVDSWPPPGPGKDFPESVLHLWTKPGAGRLPSGQVPSEVSGLGGKQAAASVGREVPDQHLTPGFPEDPLRELDQLTDQAEQIMMPTPLGPSSVPPTVNPIAVSRSLVDLMQQRGIDPERFVGRRLKDVAEYLTRPVRLGPPLRLSPQEGYVLRQARDSRLAFFGPRFHPDLEVSKTVDQVAEEMVTLYRGQPLGGGIQFGQYGPDQTGLEGRWYTTDRVKAGFFAGRSEGEVVSVSVPESVAESARLERQPPSVQEFGGLNREEYILPHEYAEQAQSLPQRQQRTIQDQRQLRNSIDLLSDDIKDRIAYPDPMRGNIYNQDPLRAATSGVPGPHSIPYIVQTWAEGKTLRELDDLMGFLNGSRPEEAVEAVRDLATDAAHVASLKQMEEVSAPLQQGLDQLRTGRPVGGIAGQGMTRGQMTRLDEMAQQRGAAVPTAEQGQAAAGVQRVLQSQRQGPATGEGQFAASVRGGRGSGMDSLTLPPTTAQTGRGSVQQELDQLARRRELEAAGTSEPMPLSESDEWALGLRSPEAGPGTVAPQPPDEDTVLTQRQTLIDGAYQQLGVQPLSRSLLASAEGATPWLGSASHPSGPGTAIAQALGDRYHGQELLRGLRRESAPIASRQIRHGLSSGGTPVNLIDGNEIRYRSGKGGPPVIDALIGALEGQEGKRLNNHLTALAVAKRMGDYALHNYSNRNDLDTLLRWVIPWHFWTTRSVVKYSERLLERPWTLGGAARVFGLIDGLSDADGSELSDNQKDRMKGKLLPSLPGWAEGTLDKVPGIGGISKALTGTVMGTDPRRMFFPMDMLGFGDSPLTQGAGSNEDLYAQPRKNLTGMGSFILGVQQLTGAFTPLIQYAAQDQWKGLLYTGEYREYLRQRRPDTVSLAPAYQQWNRTFLGLVRGQGLSAGPIPLTQTSARDMRTAEWVLYRWMAEGKVTPQDTALEMEKLQKAWSGQSLFGGRFGILGEVEVDGWAERALEEAQKVNFTLPDGMGALTGVPLTAVLPGEMLQAGLQGKLPDADINRMIFDQYGTKTGDAFRYQWGEIVIDRDKDGKPITRKLGAGELLGLVKRQTIQDIQEDPTKAGDLYTDLKAAESALAEDSALTDDEWDRYLVGNVVGDKDKTGVLQRFATDDYFQGMTAAREKHFTGYAEQNGLFGGDPVTRSKTIQAWQIERESADAIVRKMVFDRYGVEAQVTRVMDTYGEYYGELIRTATDPESFRDQDGIISWESRTGTKQSLMNLVPPAARAEVETYLGGTESVEEVARDVVMDIFGPAFTALSEVGRMPTGPEKDKAYAAVLSQTRIDEAEVYKEITARHPEWDDAYIRYHLTNEETRSSEDEQAMIEQIRSTGGSPVLPEVPKVLKDLFEVLDSERDGKLRDGTTDRLRLPNGVVVDTGKPWTDINGTEHTPQSNLDEYMQARAVQDRIAEVQGDAFLAERDHNPEMVLYEKYFGAGPVAATILQQIQALQPLIDQGFVVAEARSAAYGRNEARSAMNAAKIAENDAIRAENDQRIAAGRAGGYWADLLPYNTKAGGDFQSFETLPVYPEGYTEARKQWDQLREAYDAVRYPAEYLTAVLGEGGKHQGLQTVDTGNIPGPQVLSSPGGVVLGQQDPSQAMRGQVAAIGAAVSSEWRVNWSVDPETGEREFHALRKDDYPETGKAYVGSGGSSSSKGPSARPKTTGQRQWIDYGPRKGWVDFGPRRPWVDYGARGAKNPETAIKGLLVSARETEFLDNWQAVTEYVSGIYGGKVPAGVAQALAEGNAKWPTAEDTPDPDVRRIKQQEILKSIANIGSPGGTGVGEAETYQRGRYIITDENGQEKALPYKMNDDPGEAVKGLLVKDRGDAAWAEVEDYVMGLYGFFLPDELKEDAAIRETRDQRFRSTWGDIAAVLDLARMHWPADQTRDEALRTAVKRQVLRTLVDDLRMKEGKNPLSQEQKPRTNPFVEPDVASLPNRLNHSFVERNLDFEAVRDQVMAVFGYPNLANTRANSALPYEDREFLAVESWLAFRRANPEMADLLKAAEGIYTDDRHAVTLDLVNLVMRHVGGQPLTSLYGTPRQAERRTYQTGQNSFSRAGGPQTGPELMQDISRGRASAGKYTKAELAVFDINRIEPVTVPSKKTTKPKYQPFADDLIDRYDE